MKEKMKDILAGINEDILDYQGDNLYEDGLLDSIQVIDLVVELEEAFDVEIDPEEVKLENFRTVDAITNMIERIKRD